MALRFVSAGVGCRAACASVVKGEQELDIFHKGPYTAQPRPCDSQSPREHGLTSTPLFWDKLLYFSRLRATGSSVHQL